MAQPQAPTTWDINSVLVLLDPLSRLYPTVEDSRLVVVDVGLNPALITFSAKALANWLEILSAAAPQPGAVDTLLEKARERAPDDPALAAAIARALAAVDRRSLEAAPPVGAAPLPRRRLDLPEERVLIDRVDEVGLLRQRLEGVVRNRAGHALLLRGDSGVGKSRLAERAVRIADETGMIVLQAQCVDKRAEPLHPIRAGLSAYRGERPVPDMLLEAGDKLKDYIPFVESFLDLGPVGADARPLGGSSGYGTYDGLAQVLAGLADGPGLCLAVEDLTDADQDTLSFLEYLTDKARPKQVLIVMTAKQDLVELDPDLRDRFLKWEGQGHQVATVPPLGREDAQAFVAQLWSDGEPPVGWADEIYTLTAGNPFFIEQAVALVADRPDPAAALADVPDRVEAVIRRRFERLPEGLRDFLQAAAVALDVTHRLDLVGHLARLDDEQVGDLFDEGARLRLLTEDPQGGVAFVQEVVRRVVYEDIGPQARRRFHSRAGEWLEAAGLPASAAPHFHRAGRPEDLVRTALAGAAQAEQGGTYPSAAGLYRLAREAGDAQQIDLALARVHLILGEWDEAATVLNRLPPDLGQARVLRSDHFFVRGAFDRALDEMRLALQAPGIDQVEAMIRIGDIHLYLGQLQAAADFGRQALALAGTPSTIARSNGVIGAALYHMGEVEQAEQSFIDCATVLSAQPIEVRDRFVYTTALGNLGMGREARGDWGGARQFHEEALLIRSQVSAAREVLHSRHALIRCAIGSGSFEVARGLLQEARAGAVALQEDLEQGKLDHTEARIEVQTAGDAHRALELIEGALARFRRLGVVYDSTHALFSLAEAYAATGARRRAVEEAASARARTERGTFGLLARQFPDLAFSYRDRVEAGILAYAAGDAVGLPWEGRPPGEIDRATLPSLHAVGIWSAGETSDDTALTLLVAEHLLAAGRADGRGFMELLAARAPALKGLGPSTTAAIEAFGRTGAAPTGNGNTNGALMRSLPIGWAVPIDRVAERRAWTLELSRATHPGAEACCAAAIGAACAAWAIEGSAPDLLLEIAREEAAFAVASIVADPRISEMLAEVASGAWQPNPDADELDPYEAVTRALWCIVMEPRLPDAMLKAVGLGGDTDTVAALVGGLLGCGLPPDTVRQGIPWLNEVQLPADETVRRLAAGISDLRVRATDG